MRLIDADATLELLRSLGSRDYRRKEGTIADSMKMILHPKYTPTIEAEPVRHGRWERQEEDGLYWYECSVCGEPTVKKYAKKYGYNYFSHYCPNCGAKMNLEEE